MQLSNKRKVYIIAFAVGIWLFPLCHIIDLMFYPAHRWELLANRITVSVCIAIGIFLMSKLKEKWLDLCATILLLLSGVAITLQCVTSGEGFACPIYVGHFIIIIFAAFLFQLPTKYYLTGLLGIVLQHFIILSFFPIDMKYMALQILVFPPCAVFGIITHHIMLKLMRQVHTLQGFLPICAKCKKIRNDKGYWDQIEKYIAERSRAEFTHSLCPDCAEKLYGANIASNQ